MPLLLYVFQVHVHESKICEPRWRVKIPPAMLSWLKQMLLLHAVIHWHHEVYRAIAIRHYCFCSTSSSPPPSSPSPPSPPPSFLHSLLFSPPYPLQVYLVILSVAALSLLLSPLLWRLFLVGVALKQSTFQLSVLSLPRPIVASLSRLLRKHDTSSQ